MFGAWWQRFGLNAHCNITRSNHIKSRLSNCARVNIEAQYLTLQQWCTKCFSSFPNRMQALIEREWIQAGFPFATRHKQSCYTPAQLSSKTSASTYHFPFSLEFYTQLLILLFEHSFSSSYGTFLILNMKSKQINYIPKREASGRTKMYEPNHCVIWPSVCTV